MSAGAAKSNSKEGKMDVQTAFTVTEKSGDIFDAPDHTIIIHACNCLGSWGAGIAAAFKHKYPNAYQAYKQHCENQLPASIIGTALLIPPMEINGPKHYVGCLFTSKKNGRGKDKPEQILQNTAPALKDLRRAISLDGGVREMRICQINSGLFSVPWADSKAVIEEMEVSNMGELNEIIVYSLPTPSRK